MRVAIVGAGASGILCAIKIKKIKPNITVDLYEQNDKIAKKISVTGNGRCNITNKFITKSHYYESDFVRYIVENFGYKKLKKSFEELGIFLQENEDGKVYPLSNEARSVVRTFTKHLSSLNVNIFYNSFVSSIEKDGDGFLVLSNKKLFYNRVVLATGSSAYPKLGANNSALKFAKDLGLKYCDFLPSLVGLKSDFNYKKELFGLKKECKISLYAGKEKIIETSSDLLFTNYGVSGFGILDISYFVSKNRDKNLYILVDFVGDKVDIIKLEKMASDLSILDLIANIVGVKLAKVVLENLAINPDEISSDLNKKEFKKIYYELKNFKIDILETNGFDHAEVAIGGIQTSEVDSRTFESKKYKNLFITGEALDLVGKRGGYNLHFAFASGILAADEICLKD